jgi:hypothetical protein
MTSRCPLLQKHMGIKKDFYSKPFDWCEQEDENTTGMSRSTARNKRRQAMMHSTRKSLNKLPKCRPFFDHQKKSSMTLMRRNSKHVKRNPNIHCIWQLQHQAVEA